MSYGIFAQYYDSLTANVDYRAMAERISQLLKKHKADCSLVVDLACGTGSLCCQLAELGFDVIGVDSSPDMLSVASGKGAQGVLFLCQPMHRLDLYGTVDAVVCTLDSVNHITDPAVLQKSFERAALFLEPDGVFIFDANTEYKHKCVLADNTFVYDLDDIYCVWQNRAGEDGVVDISLDFFEPDGDAYYRSEEHFCEKAYPRDLLVHILENVGLEICEEYDDYTDKAPDEKTERVVYVCRKKGNR